MAGRVAAVSLTSTVVSNVVTYDETIALINPPATVKEGMTADVSVVDQTASNVLYVPSAAITTTGTVSTVELLQNGTTTIDAGDHGPRRQLRHPDPERPEGRRCAWSSRP